MENLNEVFTCGIWNVKPGKEKEFIKLWTDFAEWSNETGHVTASLYQEKESPSKFVSVGKWPDNETVEKWSGDARFKEWISKLSDLLSEPAKPRVVLEVSTVGETVHV